MKETYVRNAQVKRIIDGDSLVLQVALGFGVETKQHVRLAKLNCPESRGVESVAGLFVANAMKCWIEEREASRNCVLYSRSFSVGKFGRCIGELFFAGESLNDYLLASRYAWKTAEDGKLIEPRSIESLSLPEGIKQVVRERQV